MENNETLKRCCRCGEHKPLNKFTLLKRYGRDYRRSQCHECKTEMMREYRNNNREQTNITARDSHRRARVRRPETFFVYRAKQRANKLGLPFDLTEDDIYIPKTCPVLGIELRKPSLEGKWDCANEHDACPSLDRIIPELGYVKGNVMVISKRANTIKSFGTKDEHRKIIEYIERCEAERLQALTS